MPPLLSPPRPETPRAPRSDANKADQTRLCMAIGEEMDSEMHLCDLQTFQTTYLPFAPKQPDVEACLEFLVGVNVLSKDADGGYHWVAFEVSPSGSGLIEDNTFAPLQGICEQISNFPLVRGDLENTVANFTFIQTPRTTNPSEIKSSNHKVDGFFRPTNVQLAQDARTPTSAVAASAEFKKKKCFEATRDNRLKIVAAANHVMNDDPRRMFTYGITIEDEDVSLWYFSRSHSTKSRHFGFMTDVKTFVSVLLSFIFATETEIGFDSTIYRVDTPSPVSHVYQINERFFKTVRTISEYRSLCITGRTTRVWEVIEVESFQDLTPKPNAHPMVLKDVWLDATALTEKEIQAILFSDLEVFGQAMKSKDPEQFTGFTAEMKDEIRRCLEGEAYKKYFLSIECDCQGHTSRAVPASAYPVDGLFSVGIASSQVSSQQSLVSGADPSRSRGDPLRPIHPPSKPVSPGAGAQPRKYAPKRQYRVVFKQVCRALHDLNELQPTMDLLLQSTTALQLLYCAGWVHRDISSGNLLCFEDGDGEMQLVLGDLEYAKRFSAGVGSPDPKTGTSYFLPYEVHEGLYILFHQKPQPVAPIREFEQQRSVPTRIPTSVRHSFQHDLESLWWVQLWCVTARLNAASLSYAEKIFLNTYRPSMDRRDAFLFLDVLAESLKTCLPTNMHRMIIGMDHERLMLNQQYIQREQEDKLDDIASYSEIYASFRDDQSFLKEVCPALSLVPVRQPIPVRSPSQP